MGNWKTCTIGELGTVIGGATPSTKESENYEGELSRGLHQKT